ncbi:MAG: VOC family protein [Bacillota bacterium]|jgi:predicted enzyme related to lactoylglutathione lyase
MPPDGLIVFFGIGDIDRTHAFYGGLLGLRLWRDQGVCRIYEVAQGGFIGFCAHHPAVPREASPIITLVTEDVDRLYRRLVEAGVEVTAPPRENPRFRIYHFFALDPDGHKVEVQKFLD